MPRQKPVVIQSPALRALYEVRHLIAAAGLDANFNVSGLIGPFTVTAVVSPTLKAEISVGFRDKRKRVSFWSHVEFIHMADPRKNSVIENELRERFPLIKRDPKRTFLGQSTSFPAPKSIATAKVKTLTQPLTPALIAAQIIGAIAWARGLNIHIAVSAAS